MKKLKLILKHLRILLKVNPNDEADLRMSEHSYAILFQKEMALRLGHKFVDSAKFDALSKSGKKIEYKSTFKCVSNGMTISNLNDKEDVVWRIAPGVVDDKEHWFYFPKFEINNVYGVNNYEWAVIEDPVQFSKDNPYFRMTRKFVGNGYSRGKAMPSINYLIDENYTWNKGYVRAREYTVDEIKKLSNMTDEEVRNYVSYAHNEIEKELIEDNFD